MHHDHDPVDRALQSLRSQAWTGNPFNPQLEEKLMQEFTKNQSPRTFMKMPVWIAATLGVLLAGGAATGTVALVRSWLVTVQIGDQQFQFQTDESGEGTMQVQTEDGRTANVHVQRVEGDNGAAETNVNVDVEGNGTSEQRVMRIATGGAGKAERIASVEDLAGTEPIASWAGADGTNYAAHLVAQKDGELQTLFIATTTADGTQTIRRITDLPAILFAGGATTEVTPGKNGEVTVRIANGEGNVNVMKFMIGGPSDAAARMADQHIQVDPKAGQIRINGNRPAEED